MSRPLLLFTGILVLLQFPCLGSQYASAEEPLQIADAGQQASELQKQSDHHKRVEKQREEREIEKQVAALGVADTESRGLDNFVLILLVVSALALFVLSKRLSSRRGGRPPRLRVR